MMGVMADAEKPLEARTDASDAKAVGADQTSPAKPKRKARCTAFEADERVEFAAAAIVRHRHASAVRRAVMEKFGIAWRQAEKYIATAHEWHRQRRKDTVAARLDWHCAYLEAMATDLAIDARHRLTAVRLLARVEGLYNHKHEEEAAAGAEPRLEQLLDVSMTERRFLELVEEMRAWKSPTLAIVEPPSTSDSQVSAIAPPA
jgi:hypothetical protein